MRLLATVTLVTWNISQINTNKPGPPAFKGPGLHARSKNRSARHFCCRVFPSVSDITSRAERFRSLGEPGGSGSWGAFATPLLPGDYIVRYADVGADQKQFSYFAATQNNVAARNLHDVNDFSCVQYTDGSLVMAYVDTMPARGLKTVTLSYKGFQKRPIAFMREGPVRLHRSGARARQAVLDGPDVAHTHRVRPCP